MHGGYDQMVKIMLVGDSGVGKTSLLRAFCDGSPPDPKILRSTVGLDYGQKIISVKGRPILFQLWDTAGQERFRSLTPSFYRSAMGILLIFSVTDKASFNSVELWMRQINEYGQQEIPVVIVCNKIDVAARQVSEAQARGLQKRHGVRTIYTSACTNHNIVESVLLLYSQIHQQQKIQVSRHSLHLIESKKTMEESKKPQLQCKC